MFSCGGKKVETSGSRAFPSRSALWPVAVGPPLVSRNCSGVGVSTGRLVFGSPVTLEVLPPTLHAPSDPLKQTNSPEQFIQTSITKGSNSDRR